MYYVWWVHGSMVSNKVVRIGLLWISFNGDVKNNNGERMLFVSVSHVRNEKRKKSREVYLTNDLGCKKALIYIKITNEF